MLSPQPAATKVQRSPWALAGWSCLFTMLGFPVHEAAHALVYFLNGTEFIMTLNRVLPEQETVVGLLAGPLSSLVLAWLGLWAAASGKLPPAAGLGVAFGQVFHRPFLHIGMLFFGLTENDEAMAADLLGLPHAALIIPSFLLYTTTLILTARQMRAAGYSYSALLSVFVAVAAGVATVLYLDYVIFGV